MHLADEKFFSFVIAIHSNHQSHDQSKMNTNQTATKKESFKVWGQCDMCKARIEKTVKAEGVTENVWDVKTQMLTVTFDPSKTNKDAISKKLAAVGHDTEKYKATNEAYANHYQSCVVS
jgi:copper chaperone CopZ